MLLRLTEHPGVQKSKQQLYVNRFHNRSIFAFSAIRERDPRLIAQGALSSLSTSPNKFHRPFENFINLSC